MVTYKEMDWEPLKIGHFRKQVYSSPVSRSCKKGRIPEEVSFFFAKSIEIETGRPVRCDEVARDVSDIVPSRALV